MVNGSRYYRALESVSIASALSTALTIYPCQIRVHQRWQSKLQFPTAQKKEWRPATADSTPQAVTLNTVIHTTLVGLEPTTFRLLVRRATSSATDSPIMQVCNLFYLLPARRVTDRRAGVRWQSKVSGGSMLLRRPVSCDTGQQEEATWGVHYWHPAVSQEDSQLQQCFQRGFPPIGSQ